MAPSIAGTNELTIAEDKICDTLANLVSFQTWTGTGSAIDAKARVHVGTWDDFTDTADLLTKTPFALLSHPDEGAPLEYTHLASSWQMHPHFAFNLAFFASRPADYKTNKEDRLRTFINSIGSVMDDWCGDTAVLNNESYFAPSTVTAANSDESHSARSDMPFLRWEFRIVRRNDSQQ